MMKLFLLGFALSLAALSSSANELSQYTAGRVQKAHQLAEKEQFSQAIAILKALDTSRGYERAFVARMLGIFYWQNGQIQPAIKQLTLAVKSGQLKDEQAWQTQKMLADLLLNAQQFKQALPHYYHLTKTTEKNQKADQVWLRIAQSHYQLKEWKKVLSAMASYERFHLPDTQAPLSMTLSAQLELKKWRPAIGTIKRLIDLQPNRTEWWRQLVALYLHVNDSSKALDTMALAKLKGVPFDNSDHKLLAQLYAKRGIPERAAKELGEIVSIDSDRKLKAQQATYWQMAKEWQKSIASWRLAAKLDRQYNWHLAQLLVQEGQYQSALAALDKVSGRKADVALMKTRAYFKLQKFDDALAYAKRSNEMAPSMQAENWVKYLSQLRQAKNQ
ncbi:tetratricopeptide repeat protein [Vibrio sagamiensis]|uniref:Uncharacterized protein n=1 Tax=Vibrio sagamiensis NBRC 104589 TaxID=1219064 RepID=A0A511QJA7_9VIBR|nr:hypothetical protein [Vibrio sagamiensis]PNQ63023.1 hypothetical protein C1141_10420 [Vibrio agarivorans]GEM77408.1 hypothetical protein VSA01S_35200 [Vibrio sagamiensis NBRC 104589]